MLLWMLFLMIGGLGCIFVPNVLLASSGMTSLEDEPAVCWFVRILGVVFVGLAGWGLYGMLHH